MQETEPLEVAIKKVGHRDGKERFVLVSVKTREIVTVTDVTEAALRRYFRQHNVKDQLIEECLVRARKRYDQASQRSPVDEHAETQGDDLLFQLGLEEDAEVHK
jgi:hypothetical protein